MEQDTRRGNYESGADYVLEYGELRFSFNEDDFAQRVEQAAVKLDFVDQGLAGEELQDLVELAVNGEIQEPGSALGEHVVEYWGELVGPANRSLVHWLRRLVFRGAWLDQRVKEGELDIVFDDETPHLRLRAARARRGADRAIARALLGPRRLPARVAGAPARAWRAAPRSWARSRAARAARRPPLAARARRATRAAA